MSENLPGHSRAAVPGARLITLLSVGAICIAVVGYFVALADGIPQPGGTSAESMIGDVPPPSIERHTKLVDAVSYVDIPQVAMGPTSVFQSQPKSLPQEPDDLLAERKPSESDKIASNQTRSSRRAFNGAPPIIPHAVVNTNDSACYACHKNGVNVAGRKASVMSHAFLANCTQCHAPPAPNLFRDLDATVQSNFVGLPAPLAGKRAYAGAPPTIPHSQWMRENCNACHGGAKGWAGMESTHPWRVNCTQCHAPSAAMDQAVTTTEPAMLPELDVVSK